MLNDKIKKLFSILDHVYQTSIIKTLYVNFKYFGIKGIKPKVFIAKNIILRKVQGEMIIDKKGHPVHLGYRITSLMDVKRVKGVFENYGTLIFKGDAQLGAGIKILNHGTITFGKNFTCAGESRIVCMTEISFGNNSLVAWDCQIMDTDWHPIYSIEDDQCINENTGIHIGNKVWISSGALIFKGSIIPDESIIGAHGLISKDLSAYDHCILGNMNKVLKKSVYWQR